MSGFQKTDADRCDDALRALEDYARDACGVELANVVREYISELREDNNLLDSVCKRGAARRCVYDIIAEQNRRWGTALDELTRDWPHDGIKAIAKQYGLTIEALENDE